MSFYANERRVVEATIIQLALISTVADHLSSKHSENPVDEPIIVELTAVGGEIIPPLTVKDSKRLFRRIMPMKDLFLAACDAGTIRPYYVQGLATVFFINNLIAQGAFFYEEGGRFHKVIQQVGDVFSPSYEDDDTRDRAFLAAQNQLVAMQRNQYFTDVTWSLTDA